MLRQFALCLSMASGLAVVAGPDQQSVDTPIHAAIAFERIPTGGVSCGTLWKYSVKHLQDVLENSANCAENKKCEGYPHNWVNKGTNGTPIWYCGEAAAPDDVQEFPLLHPFKKFPADSTDPGVYRLFYRVKRGKEVKMVYCGVALHGVGKSWTTCTDVAAAGAAATAVGEL